MRLENPFTPGFGSAPLYLAGRKGLLEDMHRAFERGKGDPNLSTIIIGPRGTGKTALLSRIAQDASASGWVTASVSAVPGMLDDVIERTCESAEELLDNSEHLRLKGVTFVQSVGLEFDRAQRLQGNWRSKMNAVLKQLDRYETGLLITVDEVQADLDEMIQLASVYQHFVQEGRRVALLMAGLPSNVSSLISSKYVSFLRRARQRHLGRIADVEVASAFRKTVLAAGGEIDDEGLDLAVSSIDGFPYMMQLVGYWTWEESASSSIGLADVERGAFAWPRATSKTACWPRCIASSPRVTCAFLRPCSRKTRTPSPTSPPAWALPATTPPSTRSACLSPALSATAATTPSASTCRGSGATCRDEWTRRGSKAGVRSSASVPTKSAPHPVAGCGALLVWLGFAAARRLFETYSCTSLPK